jgi:hypothetical protein
MVPLQCPVEKRLVQVDEIVCETRKALPEMVAQNGHLQFRVS